MMHGEDRSDPDGSNDDSEVHQAKASVPKETPIVGSPYHSRRKGICHDVVGGDDRRWFWKNKRDKTWEEFDQANNDKLDKKYRKGKTYAHVLMNNIWQQVTFRTLEMQTINKYDKTSVKRASSKPIYEAGIDKRHASEEFEEGRSDPDGSDIDRDAKFMEDHSPEKRFGLHCPYWSRSATAFPDGIERVANDDFHPSKYIMKRKANKDRKGRVCVEKDLIKRRKNRVIVKPVFKDRSMEGGRKKGWKKTQVADGDFSPSDDDNKARKPEKNRKRKVPEEDNRRKSFGRRANKQSDRNSVADDDFSSSDDYDKARKPDRNRKRKVSKRENTRKAFGRRRNKQSDGNSGKGGKEREHRDRQHFPGESPPTPPSSPPSGLPELQSSSRMPDPFEEISVQHATKHGNIRLLRALALSKEDLSKSGQFFPLHSATALGLKRTTSFLLQSGFDLDERNESGHTPIECLDPCQDKVLLKYMRKVGGFDSTFPPATHERPDGSSNTEGVNTVNMERVDLSTRTVYLPSAQFRASFKERNPTRKLFFVSPFLSEYSMACTYQLYGLLYVLGRYNAEEDFRRVLNDVILPERSLMQCKDCSSGIFNFDTWLTDRREKHIGSGHDGEIPPWIIQLLQRKPEFRPNVHILNDGWTPMHYAVLTRNDDLVKQLLEMGAGYLKNKALTLLPNFILDQLRVNSGFEYEYVYCHIEGFTPLMLATFIGNHSAIALFFRNIETINLCTRNDIDDTLTLAYCEDTEQILLDGLCMIGKKHLLQNHQVDVNLQPHYRKDNPMRRILFGSSNDVLDEIEEEFFTTLIIVENKDIISEYLNTDNSDAVSEEEDKLLEETIEFYSDRLWRRHSSLNAIIPGHISSLPDGCQGYDKTIMVVLHSTDKELTPSFEMPFQENLFMNGSRVLVHVVESSFRFCPTTVSPLQVGCSIDYDHLRATLGVFVENSQKKVGVLTCGHTFLRKFFDSSDAFVDEKYDPDNSPVLLNVYKRKTEKRLEVLREDNKIGPDDGDAMATTETVDDDAMDTEVAETCGFVRRLLLRPDLEVGIDAALILFNVEDTVPCSPQLHLEHAMAKQQLRSHKAENMDATFARGEEFNCNRTVKVFKCGLGSGFTVGVIRFNKATGQIRFSDSSGEFEPMGVGNCTSKHIMKGQIVVHSLAPSQIFFTQGDSGSAVFLFEENSPLKCIGMGIGYMIKTTVSLVTPIRPLLEALSEDQDTTYKLLAFTS
ncbi:uncharacterized protein LOC117341018 isoform X2 [Pecten maximus]|uniref:uncharacterized protein LOC117341018 isoform X2 n=1 Tax=Pecten maximus TaxID=6579 RepID=UPI001458F954|nr:uncharacterized protein LOC117341018 isoform X2 [Pecten maximus]